MFDWVPLRGWILIAIVTAAYTPSRYILRYLMHSPARRDITQPPEDYSWRNAGRFAGSLAVVAGLAGLAVFIFTPEAVQLAKATNFWPILVAAVGVWAIFTVARAFSSGKIRPFVRGFYNTYDRAEQPKRFWASMAWNAGLGCLLIWGGFTINADAAGQSIRNQCYNTDDKYPRRTALTACNELIAKASPSDKDGLSNLLAARGSAYYWLDEYSKALSDYEAAIRLDPKDDSSHYNRGLIYQDIGDVWNAEAEYSAAIAINPKSTDAYQRRAEVREILKRQQASANLSAARLPESAPSTTDFDH